MFYVQTTIQGQRSTIISQFYDKSDLFDYACELTACMDTIVSSSNSICDILEKLDDIGPGHGARYHKKITRKEAIALTKQGHKNETDFT